MEQDLRMEMKEGITTKHATFKALLTKGEF